MRARLLLLTAAIAITGIVACGKGNNKAFTETMEIKETEQQITNLYEQMYRAMIAKDTVRLSEMLAYDFELVHMTGMHQPKSVYLKAIANGTLNYYKAETEHIIFGSITDSKAEITGQSRVNAAVFGGGRYTWPLQLKISLIKTDGKWLMVRAVANTY